MKKRKGIEAIYEEFCTFGTVDSELSVASMVGASAAKIHEMENEAV